MRTVCLSASLKYAQLIRTTIRKFEAIGIEALFPNLDCGLDKETLDLKTMKRLCQDHFYAIDRADALYVIDPQGYIGTLVKVEIGYALGRGKLVYYSERAGSLDLDALSKDVIALEAIERFLEIEG